MPNLEEIAANLAKKEVPEKPQTVMVYGAPKTGKSALVGQLAKKYKLYWFDIDRGSQVLFTAVPREFWKNIELIEIKDSQDEPRGIRSLNKLFKSKAIVNFCAEHVEANCAVCTVKKLPPAVSIDVSKLDTRSVIVVDSASRLSDSAMAHALGQQGDMIFKKKEYSHYDNQGLLLKSIYTLAQYMPCHVVFISHEEELEHEDGTSKITPVSGTRNFSRKVAAYFDHVIYTQILNRKYCISSLGISNIKVQAGNRNNLDIKSADDFLNIFSVKHIVDGKTSNFEFSHEDTELKANEEKKQLQQQS